MSICFAVRGDSINARFSKNGNTGVLLQAKEHFVSADATAIGGNSIKLTSTDGVSSTSGGIAYPGRENVGTSVAKSVLVRVKFKNISSTAAVLFSSRASGVNFLSGFEILINGGAFRITLSDNRSQSIISQNGIASGLSNDIWYDIVATFTGDTTTNGFKLYINGTLLTQFTASRGWGPFGYDYAGISDLSFGYGFLWNQSTHLMNEAIIWDSVIDPNSVALVSGTGALNGASRTSFVDVAQSAGISWPIDTQVVNTQTWNEYGVAKTGTVVVGCDYPIEEEVKDGVVYDNGNLVGSFGRHIPQTNQYWAPLEVQAEIFAILNADADLTTLLGANKIFDFVPDKTAYPYVTVNALPFIPRDNATHDGLECEFQLNVWYQPGKTGTTSRGNKPVQLIQKRLDELLEQRSLCVNGWNTLQLRRTFIDILVESDNVTRHGIQRFKLFLGSKD